MSSDEITLNGKKYRVDPTSTLEEVLRIEELGGCDIFFVSTSERWRGNANQMLSTFVDPRTPISFLDEPHTFHTHRLLLNELTVWIDTKPIHMRLDFDFMSDIVPALVVSLPTDITSVSMPSLGDIEDYVRDFIVPKKARETDRPIFKLDGKIIYNGNTSIRPGGTLRIPLRNGETIADVLIHPRDSRGQINYKVNGFVYSERVDTRYWSSKSDAAEASDTPHVLDGAHLVNVTSGSLSYVKARIASNDMIYDFKKGDAYYRMVYSLDDASYHVIKGSPVATRALSGGQSASHEYYKEIDPYFAAYMERYKPMIKASPKVSCAYCGTATDCSCGT